MRKKFCPPNTFCIDEDNIFNLFLTFIIVSTLLFYLFNNYNLQDKKQDKIIINNIDQEKDIYDRLKEPPGRSYYGKGIPINIRTRGEPNNYSQIGILTSTTNPNDIKPLYGRQTYRGSNLWNYYTALDSHLSTKIPIETNRNCIETHGCSEINSGDNINIINSTDEYKVNLYPYNDLQYIPYL